MTEGIQIYSNASNFKKFPDFCLYVVIEHQEQQIVCYIANMCREIALKLDLICTQLYLLSGKPVSQSW